MREVIFEDGQFLVRDKDGGTCDFVYLTNITVVGNIHDNPELLSDEEED